MRIAITGAMGVGKTTLTNQLSEALGIKLLPEVARQLIEEGHKLDGEATPELELLTAYYQEKLEEGDDWIADRCLIDILAYSTLLFTDEKLLNELDYRLYKAKYDIILYIPPEFPIEDDGFRSTDSDFQKKIDQEILKILKEYKYYTIKGTREERLLQALEIIKNL